MATITSVYGTGDGNSTSTSGGIAVTVDGATVPDDATQMKICSLEEGQNTWRVLHQNLNADHYYHLSNRKRGYRHLVRVDSEPDAVLCDSMGRDVWGAARPAPPSNLGTSSIGDTSITVTWTQPGDHPHASWATGYNTDLQANAPLESTIGTFTTGFSQSITGLAEATDYRLFVRTVVRRNNETLDNAISAWRSATARTTGGDSTLPGRPRDFTITRGEGKLTTTWSPAPTDSSRPITQQRVNWHPASDNPWDPSSRRQNLPADAATFTVSDLPCGVPCILHVRAQLERQYGAGTC